MFEKVNPAHPDKVADRIAGAIVDLAYLEDENPKIAVEVLIGHGKAEIIIETSCYDFLRGNDFAIHKIVQRISGLEDYDAVNVRIYRQDGHLAENQKNGLRCGDNGIFKGCVITPEERELTETAKFLYTKYRSDGKYLICADDPRVVICQSKADTEKLKLIYPASSVVVNPLGNWEGGLDVDTGATNRKLGSDMGRAATGGGLHGKDLSKADVSVNIYAHLQAQSLCRNVEYSCAIGDAEVDGRPYSEIVNIAREYIQGVGGFEKFAEWGLIR